MPKTRVPLLSYRPDAELQVGEFLNQASNAYHTTAGYRPIPGAATVGDLTSTCLGAFATTDGQGNILRFAGDVSKLYSGDGSTWADVSKVGGYSSTTTGLWDFAHFADTVIATNFYDAPQKWIVGSSTVFADLKSTSPAAPKAKYVGVINNFVFLGYTDVSGTVTPYRVQWSAIGDPDDWPTPGTTDAQDKQADEEELNPEYGPITGIISGYDFGLVFQQRAVTRFRYVGGAAIFEVDTFETNVGLAYPGAKIKVGRVAYFLAFGGLYRTDGVTVAPVGIGKAFKELADLSTFNLPGSMAIDESKSVIYMSAPGALSGSTIGVNNRLTYNYETDEFGSIGAPTGMSATPHLFFTSLNSSGKPEIWVFSKEKGYSLNSSASAATIGTQLFDCGTGRFKTVNHVSIVYDTGSTVDTGLSGWTLLVRRVDTIEDRLADGSAITATWNSRMGRWDSRGASGRYLNLLFTTANDFDGLLYADVDWSDVGE